MKLRFHVEYGLYRVVGALLRILPLGVTQAVASGLARLAFALGGRHSVTLENLRVAFPDLELERRRAIARMSYVHFAWNLIDFARAESWDAEELKRHVALVGREHADAALAKGKGLFFLVSHMGNFEIGSRRASVDGFEVLVVHRHMQNKLLFEHVHASRTRFGAEMVDRDAAAPRMLRQLRKGKSVAVLNDQYVSLKRGVFAPFLGVLASTSPGIAVLSLRTGAPVIPAFILRDDRDHHTVTFLAPLDVPVTGEHERDVMAATTAYNDAISEIIREHPEQYLWGHRRFRKSPDLVDDPYLQRGHSQT